MSIDPKWLWAKTVLLLFLGLIWAIIVTAIFFLVFYVIVLALKGTNL